MAKLITKKIKNHFIKVKPYLFKNKIYLFSTTRLPLLSIIIFKESINYKR